VPRDPLADPPPAAVLDRPPVGGIDVILGELAEPEVGRKELERRRHER